MILGGEKLHIQRTQGKTQDKTRRTQEPKNDHHVDDGMDGNTDEV